MKFFKVLTVMSFLLTNSLVIAGEIYKCPMGDRIESGHEVYLYTIPNFFTASNGHHRENLNEPFHNGKIVYGKFVKPGFGNRDRVDSVKASITYGENSDGGKCVYKNSANHFYAKDTVIIRFKKEQNCKVHPTLPQFECDSIKAETKKKSNRF